MATEIVAILYTRSRFVLSKHLKILILTTLCVINGENVPIKMPLMRRRRMKTGNPFTAF